MTDVHLTGLLVCANEDESRLVAEHLPTHVALTRAEPECVSFDVTRTADPLVWRVEERFENEAAFARHEDRVAGSEWGRMTAGIERRYSVNGVAR
jgi:quinol monooxygenase YgiN